jgi:hypothetical protein
MSLCKMFVEKITKENLDLKAALEGLRRDYELNNNRANALAIQLEKALAERDAWGLTHQKDMERIERLEATKADLLDKVFEQDTRIKELEVKGVKFNLKPKLPPKEEHPLEKVCDGTKATSRAKW